MKENNLGSGFSFVDLFAGIGGFHQAMTLMNGKCVFAVEVNVDTAKTYKDNYDINACYDIKTIDSLVIPPHDVLCAGFPCQSFSKAGHQRGFSDQRGNLFFHIVRILRDHINSYGGPKYLLLENVRNLISHDNGNTWGTIKKELRGLGYNVIQEPIIVSPHYFGIPQLRERALILAVRDDVFDGDIKVLIERKKRNSTSMESVIENSSSEYNVVDFHINSYEERVLDMWNDFIKNVNIKMIGFPIWTDYFFHDIDYSTFPDWKKNIIKKNLLFYNENKQFIDEWYMRNERMIWVKKTHRKFEWQANHSIQSLYDGIIQFRPSGVRVKKPTEFPALVAMVHVPIIGKLKRYITPREAANLQSFSKDYKIPENNRLAYKQFGNSVNVSVIHNVFREFVMFIEGNKNE